MSITLPQAWELHAQQAISDAELTTAFLKENVRLKCGTRLWQGRWNPELGGPELGPIVHEIACKRLCRVPQSVTEGLVAWQQGKRKVQLLFGVPTPEELLAMQARGWRCVSLLPPGHDTGRHEDEVAFAVHDLCHLEKFVSPDVYHGQVGFFGLVHRMLGTETYQTWEQRFDAEWLADRNYVIADMNGSSVFLFAAFKMRMRMAIRRCLAREGEYEAPTVGPLTIEEENAFSQACEQLFSMLGLEGQLREAASVISARRDVLWAANLLNEHFEALGAWVQESPDHHGNFEKCIENHCD
jgi:hypothetical protein